MTVEVTYAQARASLAKLLDKVTQDREIVIIRRRGAGDAALISADDLSSLIETAYLLRSPTNAQRLLEALGRALKNEGQLVTAAGGAGGAAVASRAARQRGQETLRCAETDDVRVAAGGGDFGSSVDASRHRSAREGRRASKWRRRPWIRVPAANSSPCSAR
jgi:antitoxin YefM